MITIFLDVLKLPKRVLENVTLSNWDPKFNSLLRFNANLAQSSVKGFDAFTPDRSQYWIALDGITAQRKKVARAIRHSALMNANNSNDQYSFPATYLHLLHFGMTLSLEHLLTVLGPLKNRTLMAHFPLQSYQVPNGREQSRYGLFKRLHGALDIQAQWAIEAFSSAPPPADRMETFQVTEKDLNRLAQESCERFWTGYIDLPRFTQKGLRNSYIHAALDGIALGRAILQFQMSSESLPTFNASFNNIS